MSNRYYVEESMGAVMSGTASGTFEMDECDIVQRLNEYEDRIAELEAQLEVSERMRTVAQGHVESLEPGNSHMADLAQDYECRIAAVETERDEARADSERVLSISKDLAEALLDVMNQACHDEDGVLDSGALSAYADAMHLMSELGLARFEIEGYGRRQFVRLCWDRLDSWTLEGLRAARSQGGEDVE